MGFKRSTVNQAIQHINDRITLLNTGLEIPLESPIDQLNELETNHVWKVSDAQKMRDALDLICTKEDWNVPLTVWKQSLLDEFEGRLDTCCEEWPGPYSVTLSPVYGDAVVISDPCWRLPTLSPEETACWAELDLGSINCSSGIGTHYGLTRTTVEHTIPWYGLQLGRPRFGNQVALWLQNYVLSGILFCGPYNEINYSSTILPLDHDGYCRQPNWTYTSSRTEVIVGSRNSYTRQYTVTQTNYTLYIGSYAELADIVASEWIARPTECANLVAFLTAKAEMYPLLCLPEGL